MIRWAGNRYSCSWKKARCSCVYVHTQIRTHNPPHLYTCIHIHPLGNTYKHVHIRCPSLFFTHTCTFTFSKTHIFTFCLSLSLWEREMSAGLPVGVALTGTEMMGLPFGVALTETLRAATPSYHLRRMDSSPLHACYLSARIRKAAGHALTPAHLHPSNGDPVKCHGNATERQSWQDIAGPQTWQKTSTNCLSMNVLTA